MQQEPKNIWEKITLNWQKAWQEFLITIRVRVPNKTKEVLDKYREVATNIKIADADNEFIGDTSLQNLKSISSASRIILWAAFLFLLIGLVWANFAVIDEVTVAEGKVVPSSEVQIVQNLEGGIIRDILVDEGVVVQKGQILMHIDPTRFLSDYRAGELKVEGLQTRLARLTAEANGSAFGVSAVLQKEVPDLVQNEKELYDSRQSAITAKRQTLAAQLSQKEQDLIALKAKQVQLTTSYSLVNQQLNMTQPLVAEGAASKIEVIRLERDANDLKGQLATTNAAIPQAQSAIDEIQSKLAELNTGYRSESIDELTKTKKELEEAIQANLVLQDRLTRTSVRSPVKGVIKLIRYNTIGGVVQPGSDLIEIVPLEDTLLIEAKVRPSDVGFIKANQEATVKITAYDYSIYGGMTGIVERIGADTVPFEINGRTENYYQILVRTQKSYLGTKEHPLPIIPGMQAQVDILTGKKSVLDYLLKPILKAKQRALRER